MMEEEEETDEKEDNQDQHIRLSVRGLIATTLNSKKVLNFFVFGFEQTPSNFRTFQKFTGKIIEAIA